MHVKALADEMELLFLPEEVVMQYLGFLGYNPDKVKVVMPEKKPKHQELSYEDKAFNQLVSSMRVTPGRRAVEHTISGIMRLTTVQEKI